MRRMRRWKRALMCIVVTSSCVAAQPSPHLELTGLQPVYQSGAPVQFGVHNLSKATVKFRIEAEIRIGDGAWTTWPYTVEDNRLVKGGVIHSLASGAAETVTWDYHNIRLPDGKTPPPPVLPLKARVALLLLDGPPGPASDRVQSEEIQLIPD